MSPEIRNLLTFYESKMASFWQIDGQMCECDYDSDRFYKLERRSRILDKEVKAARDKLVAAIEELENANV